MIYNNKCSKCGQPATHKFTRIENGHVYDIFLCPQHAAEMSPYQKQSNLSEILEGLLKHDPKIKLMTPSPAPSGIRCKLCGLAYEAYRKNFMLGCSDCYKSFHDLLMQDLRKFHGGVRHVGRKPGGGKIVLPEGQAAMPLPPQAAGTKFAKQSEGLPSEAPDIPALIEDLQRKLNHALAGENFERAARYRDQIKELRLKIR